MHSCTCMDAHVSFQKGCYSYLGGERQEAGLLLKLRASVNVRRWGDKHMLVPDVANIPPLFRGYTHMHKPPAPPPVLSAKEALLLLISAVCRLNG